MKNNILFIVWDGPQSYYLESLFFPILAELKKQNPLFNIHVLQFTWADEERTISTKELGAKLGLIYESHKIIRKPHPIIGSFLTINKGIRKIKSYIETNHINILIPRSTFPALMTLRIKGDFKIIFDADGLPLEERIETNSLTRNSFLYKFLKSQEENLVKKADAILVRSTYAIKYFKNNIDNLNIDKFFRLVNGRNEKDYCFSSIARKEYRTKLGISNDDKLLIYVGSVGGKYAINEMLELFKKLNSKSKNYKLLILTPTAKELQKTIIENDVMILSSPFNEVSNYLSAADFAICLIHQSFSMKMVAATKLGEYLINGLPTVITSEIGDFDNLYKDRDFCFLLESNDNLDEAVQWIEGYRFQYSRNTISKFGIENFSINYSVETFSKVLYSL